MPGEGPPSLVLDREALERWGAAFGRDLPPGRVVALWGDLGAGKTTLVRAICRGYGVTHDVTSPTFALVHEYEAPRSRVLHLDLYRLASPGELTGLGFDEMMESGHLVLLEWPERAGDRLPPARIDLRLSHIPGDSWRRRLDTA